MGEVQEVTEERSEEAKRKERVEVRREEGRKEAVQKERNK